MATLSIALLGACATEVANNPSACDNPKSVACVHDGSAGSSSSSTAGASSSSGGSSNGAAGTSSSSGGTSVVAGTGGTTTGASGSTSTGGGGASATGGGGTTSTGGGGSSATGGGGAKNTGGGGATSVGGGGTTSTGGTISTNPACTAPIPARTSWTGTASAYSNACTTDPTNALCNPPAYAFDADPSTRFSTGTKQVGTEWLQIDLGVAATIDLVTISTTNGDYGRHLQIRVSNTDQDTAAPVLLEQDGMTGSQPYQFKAPATGRYILISQTGMLTGTETNWWSVMDITAACN